MKRVLIILFAIVSPVVTFGQKIDAFAEINYGTYYMEGLQYYQRWNLGYPFPAKVVSSFPGFVGFKLGATLPVIKKFSSGIFIGFNSTGGKTAYSDFSGSAESITRCRAITVGLLEELSVYRKYTYEVKVFAMLGSMFNSVEIAHNLELTSSSYSAHSTQKYRSMNVVVNPGVSLSRKFGRIFFRGQVSYEMNIAGTLKQDGRTLSTYGKELSAQWDGIRIGVALGYAFWKSE